MHSGLLDSQDNQPEVPRGMAEIDANIKSPKAAVMVISTTSLLTLPIWPVQKGGGSWRMTVNYRKLSQVLTVIAAATSNVASLLEQINTGPGSQHAAPHWRMLLS